MTTHKCAECDKEIGEEELVWFNPFAIRERVKQGLESSGSVNSTQDLLGAAPYHRQCLVAKLTDSEEPS